MFYDYKSTIFATNTNNLVTSDDRATNAKYFRTSDWQRNIIKTEEKSKELLDRSAGFSLGCGVMLVP